MIAKVMVVVTNLTSKQKYHIDFLLIPLMMAILEVADLYLVQLLKLMLKELKDFLKINHAALYLLLVKLDYNYLIQNLKQEKRRTK